MHGNSYNGYIVLCLINIHSITKNVKYKYYNKYRKVNVFIIPCPSFPGRLVTPSLGALECIWSAWCAPTSVWDAPSLEPPHTVPLSARRSPVSLQWGCNHIWPHRYQISAGKQQKPTTHQCCSLCIMLKKLIANS